MYQERFYRDQVFSKFKLEVSHKESDIFISSDKPIDSKPAQEALRKYYCRIDDYCKNNPGFKTSLSALENDPAAPAIIRDMLTASKLSGIGPFSAVAGAIAQYFGQDMLKICQEVIVENGGDIFLKIKEDKNLGVYLGESFKIKNIRLKIKKRDHSFGIASSSATIGHSLNFGKADLLTVIAKDAIIADTFATAFSNKIKRPTDVDEVLKAAKKYEFIEAVVVVFEGKIFLQGDIELV